MCVLCTTTVLFVQTFAINSKKQLCSKQHTRLPLNTFPLCRRAPLLLTATPPTYSTDDAPFTCLCTVSAPFRGPVVLRSRSFDFRITDDGVYAGSAIIRIIISAA